jgi:AraC-like DNA-binding protein
VREEINVRPYSIVGKRIAHLTTDQTNSEARVSLVHDFREISDTEPCEAVAQQARMREVRGRLRNMPAPQSRFRPREADAATSFCTSQSQQLLTCAHEDMSRLNEILRSQQCTAVIRGLDDRPSGGPALSIPILDADGRLLASLDIIQGDAVCLASSEQLLSALAESIARAITERWFRLLHRRQWVIAATRRNSAGTMIVFALDREQRIVGADRQARELLGRKGVGVGRHLPLSELFRPNPTLLRRRSHCDVSTTLFSSDDGEPWLALITAPDVGAEEPYDDARILLHVRPRLDSLSHLSSLPSDRRAKQGLSRGALQRIEEYIEAHLESALDIEELAALVRMSSSHFTRSFHRSVGLTPHRYVIQNRVMRARELLATTSLPLTEIALTTGFSDQSHFSRRFHEIVGIPPGAFRGGSQRA